MEHGYVVVPGSPDSPVVLHVPHSSRTIPAEVRAGILLDDDALARELAHMTDAHTDVIAERAGSGSTIRPWLFVNQLSRLVIDPERFPDDREELRRVGMGAIYTRTSHGEPLRDLDETTEQQLLARWFVPYAQAMTDLVDARIAATGRAVVIDIHSYPASRLPYEAGGARRPAVCLGTDPVHTPGWLLDAAMLALAPCGDVAQNTPFAGCYVPLKHFGTHSAVTALMVELRRDVYLTDAGDQLTGGITAVSRGIATIIDAC